MKCNYAVLDSAQSVQCRASEVASTDHYLFGHESVRGSARL